MIRPQADAPRHAAEQIGSAAGQLLDDYDCADIRMLDLSSASAPLDLLLHRHRLGVPNDRAHLVAGKPKQIAATRRGAGVSSDFRSDKDDAAIWIVADFVGGQCVHKPERPTVYNNN